ncbi:hypothetical protein B0H13DRAFT_2307324 [Mycena leptocephala]|nr:hypothetical protein B0H13DRAFT_2307324 [Mycena leptocephala]
MQNSGESIFHAQMLDLDEKEHNKLTVKGDDIRRLVSTDADDNDVPELVSADAEDDNRPALVHLARFRFFLSELRIPFGRTLVTTAPKYNVFVKSRKRHSVTRIALGSLALYSFNAGNGGGFLSIVPILSRANNCIPNCRKWDFPYYHPDS